MACRYYKCLNSDNYFACEARQYSSSVECLRCNLQWDMNDPDPPKCMTGKELFDRQRRELKRINHNE